MLELTPWLNADEHPNAVYPGVYETLWRWRRGGFRRKPIERRFYSYWDGSRWHYGHRKLSKALRDAAPQPIRFDEAGKLVAWRGVMAQSAT